MIVSSYSAPLSSGLARTVPTGRGMDTPHFEGWFRRRPKKMDVKELKGKPAPKPQYGFHNLFNLGVAAGLFSVFWCGNDTVKSFHQWTAQRVETIQTERSTPPTAPKESVGPIQDVPIGDVPEASEKPWDWSILTQRDYQKDLQTAQKATLNTVARLDQGILHTRVTGYVFDLYVDLLRWESLTISILALLAARQRQIKPSQLWHELNKRGLTGKGQKIAVISPWGKPKNTLSGPKCKEIKPEPKRNYFQLFFPGSPIINLISEGAPDATMLVMPALSQDHTKDLLKKANEIYKQAIDNPEKFDLLEVRKLYQPIVEEIAQSVDRSIEEGATQVVISFNPEQTMLGFLFARMALTYMDLGWRGTRKLFMSKKSKSWAYNEAQRAKKWTLIDKCKNLLKEGKHSFPIENDLVAVYKPLKEALDRAYAKRVPVIIESGNYGGHKGNRPNAMGNMNPLCLIDHPGLIIVGSTNCDGKISDYTSEYNDSIHPMIGAFGSNAVVTKRTSVFDRNWGQKLLFPLGSIFFNYLRGVSMMVFNKPLWMQVMGPFGSVGTRMVLGDKGGIYPAADLAILLQKMQQVDPTLTVDEAKALLLENVEQTHFSKQYKKRLTQEIGLLPPDGIRLHTQSFVNSLRTMLKSFKTAPIRPITMNTTLGTLVIEPEQSNLPGSQSQLRMTLTSALDNEVLGAAIPLPEIMAVPVDKPLALSDFPTLEGWCDRIVEKERLKLETMSEERRVEVALEAERARRVGAGTIANRHYEVLAQTQAIKEEKDRQARCTMPTLTNPDQEPP